MKLKSIRQVDESIIGVYVWQMPDGSFVADDDNNYLSIASMKGDRKRLKEITDAARYYGIEGGHPFFLPGHRQVTDEQYEEQKMRLKLGLVPDPFDIPAITEEHID